MRGCRSEIVSIMVHVMSCVTQDTMARALSMLIVCLQGLPRAQSAASLLGSGWRGASVLPLPGTWNRGHGSCPTVDAIARESYSGGGAGCL
jgi:hypothetical protein